MTDDRARLPSNRQLLKATGIALVLAAIIMVAAVLPAEYGIDPTRVGRLLGLTSLSSRPAPNDSPIRFGLDPSLSMTSARPFAAWRSPTPPRTDTQLVTLKPNEGAEIKADMKAGERFVFTWTAEGGRVSFDMHGEKTGAATDDFTSYWKGRDSASASGEFEAPFDGRHGWYWHNRGDTPITVSVTTTGFYEKLYKPALPQPGDRR